jgi:hypothetical protein
MAEPMTLKTPLDDNQVACVELLKEALAQALEGNISCLGLVVCLQGGWATNLAGNRPGDLNLGCDDLKRKILDAVTETPLARGTSKIIRMGRQ